MKRTYKAHPKAIIESARIGRNTRIWAFAHIMKDAVIGENCNICDHCFIEGGSYIGNRVTIKNGVSVWERVHIEDDVFIGPNAVFTNDLLPVSRDLVRKYFMTTLIKKGACIGANATIVCGNTIGSYAFVGAGSVVTKDLPSYSLAYGNPASIKGFICQCRKELKFIGEVAKCICKRVYKKKQTNKVTLITK